MFCAGPGRGPRDGLVSSIHPPLLLWGLEITFTPCLRPLCTPRLASSSGIGHPYKKMTKRSDEPMHLCPSRKAGGDACSVPSSPASAPSSGHPWVGAVSWRAPDVLAHPSEPGHPLSCCLIKRLSPNRQHDASSWGQRRRGGLRGRWDGESRAGRSVSREGLCQGKGCDLLSLGECQGVESGGGTREKGWQSLQVRLEGDGVSEGDWVGWGLGASRRQAASLVGGFKQYFFHDFEGIKPQDDLRFGEITHCPHS